MQIVIEIPEGLKKDFESEQWTALSCMEMKKALENGTPLPKGHGRISDMDEAIKCIEACEGEDAIWAIALIEWACEKRTLIEADRAESEDNNDR